MTNTNAELTGFMLRPYAPHEAGYWAAQQAGFAIIKQIELTLMERDQLEDRADEYNAAHDHAVILAMQACLGNARGIIIAQARRDEAAQLIHDAYYWETENNPTPEEIELAIANAFIWA